MSERSARNPSGTVSRTSPCRPITATDSAAGHHVRQLNGDALRSPRTKPINHGSIRWNRAPAFGNFFHPELLTPAEILIQLRLKRQRSREKRSDTLRLPSVGAQVEDIPGHRVSLGIVSAQIPAGGVLEVCCRVVKHFMREERTENGV